jgi:cytochrome bd-type quinol oxidase subunit 2
MNLAYRHRIAASFITLELLAVSLADRAFAAGHTCAGVEVSNAIGGLCSGVPAGTNPIFALVSVAIRFFSMIFGLLLVLVVVIAGIQYITAGGSADNTKEAKERLKAAVTGLVLFVLMFGILQVLLPPEAKIFR